MGPDNHNGKKKKGATRTLKTTTTSGAAKVDRGRGKYKTVKYVSPKNVKVRPAKDVSSGAARKSAIAKKEAADVYNKGIFKKGEARLSKTTFKSRAKEAGHKPRKAYKAAKEEGRTGEGVSTKGKTIKRLKYKTKK